MAVAGAGLAGPRILTVPLAEAAEGTPEAFLATLFAQRAQAMTTGDANPLAALYDPGNRALVAFEKERSLFYAKGLGARWGGSTVLAYASKPELLSLVVEGDRATAQVYERTEISWIAKVQPEVEADQQRNPGRYRITPVGPRGETASGIGVRHELTLTRVQSGWRVAKDAFDEYMLYLTSPDVVPGSWVDERGRARMPMRGVPDHSSI